MKAVIGGFTALALLFLIALTTAFPKTYDSPEALMTKVRKEIDQAEADTIEMVHAGTCEQGDKALLWYITGNEYQAHGYYPAECRINEKGKYELVRVHTDKERTMDIATMLWGNGHAFCINNPKCRTLRIVERHETIDIPIDPNALPFVYYCQPSEWHFYDAEGKEML